jgi:hypothetical protein
MKFISVENKLSSSQRALEEQEKESNKTYKFLECVNGRKSAG